MKLSSILPTLAAVLAFCTIAPSANAQDMRLIYNSGSGNVQIRIINPMIALFSIETRDNTNGDDTGFLRFANVDATTGLGAPTVGNRDSISWNTSGVPFETGTYDIGNVLDSGIDFQPNAADTLSLASDAGGQFGFGALSYTVTGVGSLQTAFESVTGVPEPTTVPLLMLAATTLFGRRRKP